VLAVNVVFRGKKNISEIIQDYFFVNVKRQSRFAGYLMGMFRWPVFQSCGHTAIRERGGTTFNSLC
jgi:hypothetical protein